MVLFNVAMGAAGGFAMARRGYPRLVGIALLLAVTLLAASGWAARWDWRTRNTPLGGTADTEKRFALEAQATADNYNQSRQRWMAMSNPERWKWRLSIFAVVSCSILCGGISTLLLAQGRADRITD